MNDFLPKDYDVPTASSGTYMKLEMGENRIRVLASPILGFEYWVTLPDGGRKPRRVRIGTPIPQGELELDPKSGEPERPKHFWAMPVWSYKDEQIEILELTQNSIQKELQKLANDSEWGSPLGYDITIIRDGEGLKTTYSVTPKPAKPLDPKIEDFFKGATINLEALYDGGNPFGEVVTEATSKTASNTEEEVDLGALPF